MTGSVFVGQLFVALSDVMATFNFTSTTWQQRYNIHLYQIVCLVCDEWKVAPTSEVHHDITTQLRGEWCPSAITNKGNKMEERLCLFRPHDAWFGAINLKQSICWPPNRALKCPPRKLANNFCVIRPSPSGDHFPTFFFPGWHYLSWQLRDILPFWL